MFNGIINDICSLIYFKYIYSKNFLIIFIILKINNLFYINLNLGSSIIVNGICLTLIHKNINFFEFELSYNTIVNCNIFSKYLNIEKSLFLFNNIDGHLLYGHINYNFLLISKIYYLNNFYKICLICNFFFKNYIFYKYSIFLNGINLTINEVFFTRNYILFCISLINFTVNFTNIRYIKLFNFINIEFDLTIFFILIFLYF